MKLLPLHRDDHSAPFFDAAGAGQLLIRKCSSCHSYSDPTAHRCAQCHAADIVWAPSIGTGKLITWAISHVRTGPGHTAPSHAVGIVELTEGPWLHVALMKDDLSTITADKTVTVRFHQLDVGDALPVVEFD